MEEGTRMRAREEETDENPRKSPRLELPAAADSECDAAAALLGLSDRTEKAAAVTSDTDSGQCDHINIANEDLDKILSQIKSYKEHPKCEHYFCETTRRGAAGGGEKGAGIMVCLDCSLHFCTGVAAKGKPQGHARWHANLYHHWVALRYNEPHVGYCFMCEQILFLEKNEGMVVDKDAGGHASRIANGNGYVIRGMPNLGNTCYLNALVQCLLALGMLRTRMLGPDAPSGLLGTVLQDLFVETSSAEIAGRMLYPTSLLGYIRLEDSKYIGSAMQDSHELLLSLRSGLDKEEKLKGPPYMQEGAPSAVVLPVTDSIFRGHLSATTSCKFCSVESVSYDVFYDLSVPLTSKEPPARTVRSQREIPIKLYPAIDKISAGKVKKIAEGGDSQVPGSELGDVVIERTPKPLKVDCTEVEQIWQSKGVGPLHTQKDDVPGELIEVPLKSVDFLHHFFDGKVGVNATTADSHSSQDIGVPPLVSPQTEKNERMLSSSDVEQNDNAGLYDMFSESTCSVEVTSEDKGKAQSCDIVYDEAEHRNSLLSIEDCLALHFKDEVKEWHCENCSKVAEQLTTNGSKGDGWMMASTNVNTAVDGDQPEQSDRKTCQNEQSSDLNRLAVECTSSSRQPHGSDAQQQVMLAVDQNTKGINSGVSCGEKDSAFVSTANKKPECHEGVQEAVPSCLLDEKPIILFSAQDVQNVSTQNQGRGELVKLDHSAHQLDENQNDQKDENGGAIRTCLISKLPPVLIIHLKRYTQLSKVSGHVSFKEILDVGPFMDPRSEDKDNSRYRLVGVIEHIGLSDDVGHYVAYVRAGHKPHSSGSSSWFCADDTNIREASLEEVLSCEAYMLFYERMEG